MDRYHPAPNFPPCRLLVRAAPMMPTGVSCDTVEPLTATQVPTAESESSAGPCDLTRAMFHLRRLTVFSLVAGVAYRRFSWLRTHCEHMLLFHSCIPTASQLMHPHPYKRPPARFQSLPFQHGRALPSLARGSPGARGGSNTAICDECIKYRGPVSLSPCWLSLLIL